MPTIGNERIWSGGQWVSMNRSILVCPIGNGNVGLPADDSQNLIPGSQSTLVGAGHKIGDIVQAEAVVQLQANAGVLGRTVINTWWQISIDNGGSWNDMHLSMLNYLWPQVALSDLRWVPINANYTFVANTTVPAQVRLMAMNLSTSVGAGVAGGYSINLRQQNLP